MFPELSDLVQYLFGISLPLPIQTFTFFLALSFVAAYQVFKSELIRKEKEGLFHPFIHKGEQVHPYEIMETLVVWSAFWGFLGAKIFACLEDWNSFIQHPLEYFFSINGLAFYGGFVGGALYYFYLSYKKGFKLIHMADIGALGMMVSYGVGRIGCHFAGDGDWGIVNTHTRANWLPDWAWSYTFPHNTINAGIAIPGCTGEHCMVLPQGVYPTSLYEAVFILTVFTVLWFVRRRIKTRGILTFLYFVINGPERFLIELIRVNYKYQVFGLQLSQAQLIALLFIIIGISGFEMMCWTGFIKRGEQELKVTL